MKLTREELEAIRAKRAGDGDDQTAGDSETPGADFEERIKDENEILRAQNAADVFKVPNPIKIHSVDKANNRVVGRKTTPVWVDFTGIADGGRHVSFEAKSTKSVRFKFDNIKDHQIARLHRVAKMGGIAFFYAEHRVNVARHRYVFPVDADGLIDGVRHKRDRKGDPVDGENASESIRFDQAGARKVRLNETWLDAYQRILSE